MTASIYRRGSSVTPRGHRTTYTPTSRTVRCAQRREGDEMACRCGARWPVGEDHP